MSAIRAADITLEICPTSNLLTKALADEDEVRETFRTFVENGVAFTIATDGPEMMRTHLRDEFELLRRIGALTEDELAAANVRGHEASFLGGARARTPSQRYTLRPIPRRQLRLRSLAPCWQSEIQWASPPASARWSS